MGDALGEDTNAVIEPTITPMAGLLVATMQNTVTTMTAIPPAGIRLKVLGTMEYRSKAHGPKATCNA